MLGTICQVARIKGFETGTRRVFLLAVLGFELKAYTLSHSTSPFFLCDRFFSRPELFAQAGFEP
jgi:hypothetical protein